VGYEYRCAFCGYADYRTAQWWAWRPRMCAGDEPREVSPGQPRGLLQRSAGLVPSLPTPTVLLEELE
jgi:hypothetical protein